MFKRIRLQISIASLVSAFVLQPAFSTDRTAFVSCTRIVTKTDSFREKASEFAKLENELKDYVASCNKQYETKKAANATQDELKALQEKLQAEITAKTNTIQARAKETETQMESCIKGMLRSCCEAEGLDPATARISSQEGDQARANEVDLTEKILSRLNEAELKTKLVSPVPIMPKLAPQ